MGRHPKRRPQAFFSFTLPGANTVTFPLDDRGNTVAPLQAPRFPLLQPARPSPFFPQGNAPLDTDVFLREMGADEQIFEMGNFELPDIPDVPDVFDGAAMLAAAPAAGTRAPIHAPIHVPDTSSALLAQGALRGLNYLYPGYAGVPCLGVITGSDSAGRAKKQLLEIYSSCGLRLRCHTCGRDLDPEWVWVGDHQPPTADYARPDRLCHITNFTAGILVVESSDKKFQTRLPVPPELEPLFRGQRPHSYPLFKEYPLAQRYIYPQCSTCSDTQRNFA